MKKIVMTFMLLTAMYLSGCTCKMKAVPVELDFPLVPTPSTFDDVISYMVDNSAEKRMTGMWAVLNYPDDANSAIPLLIQNLYYQTAPDVRERAAEILGMLNEKSVSAVPALIDVAENDTSINVLTEVAFALGDIGDKRAIPTLANNLYKNDEKLATFSAKSIAKITGEKFTDYDSIAYTTDRNGIPLIVIDAREWWQEEGQFEDWSTK